jgi:transposase
MVATSGVRPAQRPVEVCCGDASPFPHEPSVQRGWWRPGQRGTVPTPTRRHSAPLLGALPLRTQRCYGKRAPRGTSQRFLEFLPQLHQRFPEALRIVVLENATLHKSRAVKRLLTQHDGVVLEPLAPYAPEDNPSERFWQGRKAKVDAATALHTIDDVLCKVRQLMWHDHEGWLTSTLHCDFTLYREIL